MSYPVDGPLGRIAVQQMLPTTQAPSESDSARAAPSEEAARLELLRKLLEQLNQNAPLETTALMQQILGELGILEFSQCSRTLFDQILEPTLSPATPLDHLRQQLLKLLLEQLDDTMKLLDEALGTALGNDTDPEHDVFLKKIRDTVRTIFERDSRSTFSKLEPRHLEFLNRITNDAAPALVLLESLEAALPEASKSHASEAIAQLVRNALAQLRDPPSSPSSASQLHVVKDLLLQASETTRDTDLPRHVSQRLSQIQENFRIALSGFEAPSGEPRTTKPALPEPTRLILKALSELLETRTLLSALKPPLGEPRFTAILETMQALESPQLSLAEIRRTLATVAKKIHSHPMIQTKLPSLPLPQPVLLPDIEVMRVAEQFLRADQGLRQLLPAMQSAGLPAFILVPGFVSGMLSKMEVTFGKFQDESAPASSTDKPMVVEALALHMTLPSCGRITAYLGIHDTTLHVTVGVEDSSAVQCIAQHLEAMRANCLSLGFSSVELSVGHGAFETRPRWARQGDRRIAA